MDKRSKSRPKWKLAMESDIATDNISGIIDGVFAITEYGDDPDYEEGLCLRLSEHSNADVRAAAILGFGYIARAHRTLKNPRIKEIVNKRLKSSHDLERVHSKSARDDIEIYLGWSFKE